MKRAAVSRFKFTYPRLAALKPPAKGWTYHYDTMVPRLAVGIGPSGAMTFVLQKKIHNKHERVKLGRLSDQFGIEAARAAAEAHLGAVRDGKNPAEERRAILHGKTLKDVFGDFIPNRQSRRGGLLTKKTRDDYTSMFNCHLKDFHSRPLAAITRAELRELHRAIGATRTTMANRVIEMVSSMYAHAMEDSKFYPEDSVNPAHGIKPFPEKKRRRFVKHEEFPTFMRELDATPEPWRSAFSISLFTGMRIGAVLALRWVDVDLGAHMLLVRENKGGEPTPQPMSAVAVRIFKKIKRRDGNEWVFPSHAESGHLEEYKGAWKDLFQRAGFAERLVTHDLRRTFGSWQAQTGSSVPIIGRSLSHKSSSSTEPYIPLVTKPVRESVDRATAAMRKAAKGKGRAIFGDPRKRAA